MPAVASLEDLKKVEEQLLTIKENHLQGYAGLVELFRQNRKIGYKNICKMMMGEATPEKLKGIE
ncbi:MAG TPA: hypothetical protein ENI06_01525 [Spirochaetales bacterium]|nr:hypothetical protein [Spirochaetales bacterium]